ncbi:hypothetical protein K3162_02150 [Qipengyuania xiapuensis]|uniref:Uncharacterized protein n=1 Tax=Qipengyuania xiapuensis TaxID=2867236 RepID=A0ABX8ZV14_9SPHN|nr:hypothetical protein [Qipengyuania xiapuensis]QZD92867.1 hypothetical protein K3162_02150 [Qipengyuania xiapuensis]
MPSLAAFIAPIALILPLGGLGLSVTGEPAEEPVVQQSRPSDRNVSALPLSADAPAWSPILDGIAPPTSQQVRIERRVILRISPARAPGPARQNLAAETTRSQQPPAQLVERKAGKCLDSARIRGVSDRGDHLLMLMRDRSMMVARLEKGCSPRDFYRGFYVERSDDGKLCVKRDRIMSRSGAKCQIDRFSELVAERPE